MSATPAPLPPLEPGARRLATVALSLATFMNVLDTTIANVSIPNIAGDLGVSPGQGTWVITSFAVANAISVPLTGWLTQRFGAVRLFTMSVLLFVLAAPRRKVALRNLALCFPEVPEAQRRAWARATFVVFCQTFLDRGWLWSGSEALVRSRVTLTGAVHELLEIGVISPEPVPTKGLGVGEVAAAVLGAGESVAVEARVASDRLEVFDAADATGYVVATLRRGDSVRVQPGEAPGHGWLAIQPPSAVSNT